MSTKILVPNLDMDKPPGQRFAPQVREEIAEVAPSTVNDGEITTNKLDDRAVTNPKIALGAVQSENIGAKQVKTANIDDQSVGTDQLDDEAVTPDKAGPGVMTVFDSSGNPIQAATIVVTDQEWSSLTPAPNTFYEVLDT